MYKEMISS